MSQQPPNLAIRGIRQSLPSGYVLGRQSKGSGPAELITHQQLAYTLIATGQVVGGGTQLTTAAPGITGGGDLSAGLTLAVEWNAGTVAALGNGLKITSSTISVPADNRFSFNTGTLALANTGASTLFGNSGTVSAEPSGTIAIGTGLSLTPAGTLNATATSGVTSITFGNGLSGGTITGSGTVAVLADSLFTFNTGTIALANIASGNLIANSTTGSAEPSSTTLTALLDRTMGSTQGDLISRGSSAWQTLAPGTTTTHKVLLTNGSGAGPTWTDVNTLLPSASVKAATNAVLSNTPTYSNGSSGVGATLTAGSNGALTVDGYVVVLGDVIIVKNQASTLQNGVYVVTTLGTAGVPYVLTRHGNFDTAEKINAWGGAFMPVGSGTANMGTCWTVSNVLATMGTSAFTFALAATSGWNAGTVTALGTGLSLGSGTLTAFGASVISAYTSAGTSSWAKPSNCSGIIVIAVGAGGGGGGASGAAAGSLRKGGSGGGGGSYVMKALNPADITGPVTVIVGAGGLSGGGGSSTTGSDGGVGGDSSFGSYVKAYGGGAGGGSSSFGASGAGTGQAGLPGSGASGVGGRPAIAASVGGQGGAGGGSISQGAGQTAEYGGAGGGGANTAGAVGSKGGSSIHGGAGGGAGGGVTAATPGTATLGGDGGGVNTTSSSNGTTSSPGPSSAAINTGTASPSGNPGSSTSCGQGGAGGSGNNAGTGSAGGAGGTPGGGGGGGGGGTSVGGAGGVGGDGSVWVISW